MHQALDHLRTAVFGEREVALLQRGHQRAMLVAHCDREQHLTRLHMQGGHRLVIRRLLRRGLLGNTCQRPRDKTKCHHKMGEPMILHFYQAHFQFIRRGIVATVDC